MAITARRVPEPERGRKTEAQSPIPAPAMPVRRAEVAAPAEAVKGAAAEAAATAGPEARAALVDQGARAVPAGPVARAAAEEPEAAVALAVPAGRVAPAGAGEPRGSRNAARAMTAFFRFPTCAAPMGCVSRPWRCLPLPPATRSLAITSARAAKACRAEHAHSSSTSANASELSRVAARHPTERWGLDSVASGAEGKALR